MPAIGKLRQKTVKGVLIYTDEAGQTFSFPPPPGSPFIDYIDPRIDLTKPIYEQVLKLEAKDKAAAARAEKRRRKAAVA